MTRKLGFVSLVLIAMTAGAQARVTRIEIGKREPFAAGQAFGTTGAYEKIVGRYHGALDPAHPLNAGIVDLDKAPRNALGLVEYAADFYILKPVDLAKGNGAIFYEANNRGNKAALGRSDGTPPETVRIYHFAGTQHGGIAGSPGMQGVCAMPSNRTDYRPFLCAALANLDRWVKDGVAPPASRYPRIDDGTLVEKLTLAAIPGLTPAHGPSQRPRIDFGPDFDKGSVGKTLPVALADSYRVLVPKVDADGNEVAGLRLPDISVPTGTAAGWNVRAPNAGAAGELCYLEGSRVPFAKTKAERVAKNDPRPSLAERYKDHADYVERVRQAATALQRDGYVLAEDATRIVERAASW